MRAAVVYSNQAAEAFTMRARVICLMQAAVVYVARVAAARE